MSVAPETLDTALCEWCIQGTRATAKAVFSCSEDCGDEYAYLCSTHCQEIASEFTKVSLYPVANKPEYTTLETEASPMTGEWTIAELERSAKYGAPYPVCGDLTTKQRRKILYSATYGKTNSWVGHDPSGEQY